MTSILLFFAPRVLLLIFMSCALAYIQAGFTSRRAQVYIWAFAVATVLIIGGICG